MGLLQKAVVFFFNSNIQFQPFFFFPFLIHSDLYILSIFRYVFNRYGLQLTWLSQLFLQISKFFPKHLYFVYFLFFLCIFCINIKFRCHGKYYLWISGTVQWALYLKENIFTLAYLLSLNCKYSWDCLHYSFIPLFYHMSFWKSGCKTLTFSYSWLKQLVFSHSADSALLLDGMSK